MQRLLVLAVAVLLVACSARDGEAPHVVVGVGSTAEQRLLATVAAVALERAGMRPELRSDLGGTRGLRQAAFGGNVDVFWDYTGAAWGLGMGQQAPPADLAESYERVRRADEERGLAWLTPSTANATLGLFVRADDLPPAGRRRGLSWLATVLSEEESTLCADSDFVTRSGGLDALAAAYEIDLARPQTTLVEADQATAIAGAADGTCFAALATVTSGAARARGLVPLVDDLQVFPAFVVAPVARADRAIELGLADALAPVTRALDTEALARMNARVVNGAGYDEVARDFVSAALAGP